MNLQDVLIAGAPDFRYIWGYWQGGNGRVIDRGKRHLVPQERGTPYPLHELQRRWWHPWTGTDHRPLEAICGNIRTRAVNPWFYADGTTRDPWNPCEDCRDIANARGIEPATVWRLAQQDPWNLIPLDQRVDTPDPVTGL